MNSEKKPYIVTLEYEIAVLADNESDAKSFMGEALKNLTSYDIEDFSRVQDLNRFPDGWEKDHLIYHDGNQDITLSEALSQSEQYQRILRQLKEYENRPQMDGHNA